MGGSAHEREERRDAFVRASWVNVLGNALKVAVEGGIGVVFGSVALVADATHSVADLVSSLVVLVYGRLSFTEADDTHPHGHQRIEPLTALFVGAAIVILALLLLRDSALKILERPDTRFSLYLVGGLVFAGVDMLGVYLYTKRVNERVNSPSLRALEKDCLNDIYTTVAAVVGVGGIAFGQTWLDPVAGGVVAVMVAYQGVEIASENLDYLTGGAPDEEKQDEVLETVLEHPSVEGVHDFTAHYVGPEVEVEMHVEVDGDMSLREAHDLETEVVGSVRRIDEVGDVHVHLDPSGIGEWKTEYESKEGSGMERDGDSAPDREGQEEG
ncbi:MAG: cation diffusion facilitator family transporter [Halobacteria archaeon]|nr:cation diffusion facilitator family transporter [Halobacteria archaeon]